MHLCNGVARKVHVVSLINTFRTFMSVTFSINDLNLVAEKSEATNFDRLITNGVLV